MQRKRSSFTAAARAGKEQWENLQVELHGEFPLDHISRFEEYVERTPWWRALLVCLWTPIPTILVTLAIELNPLEDPRTHNARQSPRFWLRCFIVLVLCSVCYMEQFRQHVPSLELPRRLMLPIAIAGSTVAIAFIFLLADLIAYPFPFLTNAASMAAAPVLVGLLWFFIRDQLPTNPRLGPDLRRHLVVCVCQIVMITIYPIYNTLFVRASSWGQTAMVFILPIIKLLMMNCISRWIANSDEARPESVIFNVEVFHALYVSFSMQSSTAIHTMAAIMAVDAGHAWLSFRDVARIAKRIKHLTDKVSVNCNSLVALTSRVITADHLMSPPKALPESSGPGQIPTATVLRPSTLQTLQAPTRVHPFAESKETCIHEKTGLRQPSPIGSMCGDLSELTVKQRALLVQQTQKLLFTTEFVALIEYTEVLMPFIFNMCILAMYYLPNQQYYSFLRDLSTDELSRQIANVFLYASLELASLVVMGIVLWRKLRLSLLHQIAFVLETRQASIQSKVVMWALNVLQNQVQHTGVDYSFQFAWLKPDATS